MADILYKIEYDDKTGFNRPLGVVVAIHPAGNPDRIAFVATQESEKYAAKNHKVVAVQREKGRDPFDSSMPQTYIVPVEGKGSLNFFVVHKSGEKGQFHLICGQSDKEGNNFEKWKRGSGEVEPSIPFP